MLKLPLLPHDPKFEHVNAAVVLFLFLTIASLIANRAIKGRRDQYLIPSKKFNLVNICDLLVEGLYGMVVETLGPTGVKYFAFVASLFIFVLFGNLLGLIPHSAAPTGSVNTTFALGLATFVYYNVMGVVEHGPVGYAKHFLMGLGIAGIPIALLELISHAVRPVSLGVRLFVNMFVDHALASQFGKVFAWFLPVPLLFLGIVVCMIQAFVFAMLTTVYLQMATEHEHAAEEGHGHAH